MKCLWLTLEILQKACALLSSFLPIGTNKKQGQDALTNFHSLRSEKR